jgi:V/A-type H+-transporting ATPase subunit E
MDVNLEKLIEKIKVEGVEEAQRESDKIVKKAEKEASSIVEKAKTEAEKIVKDGETKASQFRENAEADLRQAVRNAELLLKERINSLFDQVFKRKVTETMEPDFLKNLILTVIDKWAGDRGAEITVDEKTKKGLEKLLFSSLKEDLRESITLKSSADISTGFRVALKGEEVYYDFSDEAVAEALRTLLNPRLKEILDANNG